MIERIWNALMYRGLLKFVPNKIYLSIIYYFRIGQKIDLKNPKGFNEKLQWLKLYDHDPLYTKLVDKYEVKDYVTKQIGKQYLISTIGIYNSFDEINFDNLPNQFVIKTTHDSGGVIVCKDKKNFDLEKAKEKINSSLKRNYYYSSREWPYKNVVPRIIIEQYMKDGNNDFLPVYKFMCFNGNVEIIQTIQNDKQPNESIDYFDVKWNILDLKQNYPNSEIPLKRPEKLEEMIKIAEKLSKSFPFIRVDLYIVNNEIYFSEFTFYSDAGFAAFTPRYWDEKLGEKIDLNMVMKNEK